MDKSTLSNYGWIVIAVLVLAVMIALATPFGKYVESGVRSTTAGLFETSEKALNVVGMTAGEGNFEDGYAGGQSAPKCCESPNVKTYVDDTKCEGCGLVTYGSNIHNGIIPEGATYIHYTNGRLETFEFTDEYEFGGETYYDEYTESYFLYDNVETLTAGTPFPTFSKGDTYKYGNYEYCYGMSWCDYHQTWSTYTADNLFGCSDPSETNYLQVHCADIELSNPGNFLTNINGIDVTNADNLFAYSGSENKYLTTAPVIPETITSMKFAFDFCTKLTGTITINANINLSNTNTYKYCFLFADMSNVTLTGSAPKEVLNALGATGDNYTPIQ